ncbi:hypothetical protein C8R44DRAFT_780693, partial [Mycena epipterygia]
MRWTPNGAVGASRIHETSLVWAACAGGNVGGKSGAAVGARGDTPPAAAPSRPDSGSCEACTPSRHRSSSPWCRRAATTFSCASLRRRTRTSRSSCKRRRRR